MSQSIVRAGFESRLKTWADAQTPAIPVAWENKAFTPPVGRYVRASLIPAPTSARTLERTDRSYTGVFQALLCMPIDKGVGSAESLGASLDAHFSSTFTQGSLQIWLLTPFRMSPGFQADERYVVPVWAEYAAQTYS
jgi:Bacteriophage related domain of unknown function